MKNMKIITELEDMLIRIGKDLETLKRSGSYSRLDVEITLEHIRRIYDKVHELNDPDIWKKGSQTEETKPEKVQEPEKKEVPEVKASEPKPEPIPVPEPVVEQKEEAPVPIDEVPQKQSEEVKPPKSNGDKLKESAPKKRKIDMIQEKSTTLADKFMEKDDKTVAARINKNPVSDLRKAIGINDKFLFVKELFKNEIKEYDEALNRLNSFPSLDDAGGYLEELKKNHKWDTDNEFFVKFREIVERKYS
jgi:hypothetical protein